MKCILLIYGEYWGACLPLKGTSSSSGCVLGSLLTAEADPPEEPPLFRDVTLRASSSFDLQHIRSDLWPPNLEWHWQLLNLAAGPFSSLLFLLIFCVPSICSVYIQVFLNPLMFVAFHSPCYLFFRSSFHKPPAPFVFLSLSSD